MEKRKRKQKLTEKLNRKTKIEDNFTDICTNFVQIVGTTLSSFHVFEWLAVAIQGWHTVVRQERG